jgi:hypothetical protein
VSYCPNCSAELESRLVGECWNCHATFGDNSEWKPSSTPSGEFRRFPKQSNPVPPEAQATDSTTRKVVNGFGLGLALTFFVAVGLIVLLVAMVLSTNPCITCK